MFCIGGGVAEQLPKTFAPWKCYREIAQQFPMAFAKYGLDEIAQQFPKTFAKQKAIFPVVMRLWDTPVPIPNTMVKT